MADEITLEFIGRSLERINDELRDVRKEIRDVRLVVLDSVEQVRRLRNELEERFRSTRDDLELMIRSEGMGRAAHMETFVERTIGSVADRVSALEDARA